MAQPPAANRWPDIGGNVDVDVPAGAPVPRAGSTEKVPVTTSMMAHAGTNKNERAERGIGGFLDPKGETAIPIALLEMCFTRRWNMGMMISLNPSCARYACYNAAIASAARNAIVALISPPT
jgi:hypothetical protein